jgi:predicted dehydrogenase
MHDPDRRRFLRHAALFTAGFAAARPARLWAQVRGANGDVRVGVIGLGWHGKRQIKRIAEMSGVRIAAICDVDPTELAAETERQRVLGNTPFATTDARHVLDRADVDAVFLFVPDQWHALLTVWACQTGKDVFVEKPLSHTVGEGARMLEAVAKYGRIAQIGTQARSDAGLPAVRDYLHSGALGAIQWGYAIYNRNRLSIGRKLPWYPRELDYDRWCGPSPVVPLTRANLHYDWHWYWHTGGGDMTNIAVHAFDVARWLTGNTGVPRRVMNIAGRHLIDDTAETPNTQLAIMDYGRVPLFVENRGLFADDAQTRMDAFRGIRTGVVIQCEGGYFAGLEGGWVYDRQGKRMKHFEGDGGGGHLENFLAAVRTRRAGDLTAPLAEGHASSASLAMANISYRMGRKATMTELGAAVEEFPVAGVTLRDFSRHLSGRGIDLTRDPLTQGAWIEPDPLSYEIKAVSAVGESDLERARHLWRGVERPGYELPVL